MKLTGKTAKAMADVHAYAAGKEARGRVTKVTVEDVDVRVIREKLKLSQEGFAERFGFPIATLKNWEQGRRKPENAAKVLLRLIERQPKIVEREVKRVKEEMQTG
jgi:putative transcriptional regulator